MLPISLLKPALLTLPVAIFAIGWGQLTAYSSRPGTSGTVVTDLSSVDDPTVIEILQTRPTDRPLVVMFYHPHCPCTVASARCLERLTAKFQTAPLTIALAYCPNTKPDSWINSSSTKILNQLDRTQVFTDRDGKISQQFGAETSGHFLVYNEHGLLTFSGGITSSRGHEGDCRSASEFVHQINQPPHLPTHWPVFGCRITDSNNQSGE